MRALKPGDLIADRYRIDTRIARGGMGAVYRATDERIGRAVAIKVLVRELADDETAIARFEREATASARIEHPGIVQVLDFGHTTDGMAYLVMEHVSGETLAQVLDRETRLAPARAADIVEQALGALALAHDAGIVHRDLKPGNLMLVAAGLGGREVVKLLDFGVALLRTTAAYTRLTQAGDIVGTPAFMAPEQARGDACDARADVYAMGMVLWCCLTGRRPFVNADIAELLVAVQNEVPPRADSVAPDVPEVLATIAARALEKRPEDRFQSARELAAALLEARAAIDGPTVRTDAVRSSPPQAWSPPTRTSAPRTTPPTSTPAPALAAPASTPAPAMPSPALPPPAPSQSVLEGRAPLPLWLRMTAAFVAAASVAAAIAVVAIALGVLELGQTASAPPITTPTTAPAIAAPPIAPQRAPLAPISVATPQVPATRAVQGVETDSITCTRALECCRLFVELVDGVEAPCEELIRTDDASCRARMDAWSRTGIDRGVDLVECQIR